MTLSARQLLEVKELTQTKTFELLKEFINNRQETHLGNADSYSEELTKLLVREQEVGSAKTLRTLLTDFVSHVDTELKQAQEKEAK